MTFIEPLNMQTWLLNVWAGNPNIFIAAAIILISAMAGYFRMPIVVLFFSLGIFFVIFAHFVGFSFVVFMGIIAGFLISFWISRIVKS